ncbi:D-alanine--D-alanine ligase [Candidatus Gottesmanbacteria bacterium]|nr:D-alanine--D-alanine ligase [Candidatus Gottesmanbacteria bacterium]
MEHIGVFFGSRSPEHDVSIITAQLVIAGLKALGKNIVPVYIDKHGNWFLGSLLGNLSVFQSGEIDSVKKRLGKFTIDLEKSKGKLVFHKLGLVGGKEITIDLAFPTFHGSYGEDGTVQGLFEMFDIPYVGCGVASSAIAMDKVLTKQYYQMYGFPTTKFLFYLYKDWNSRKKSILAEVSRRLRFPVFIKPARLGSSIGIQKVKGKKNLEFAFEVAFHYDEKVIVEESVDNLVDITCCVIGNSKPIASKLQESIFQSTFFSFEEKYLKKGGAQLGKAKGNIIIPARVSDRITKEIQKTAEEIFACLECRGIARIDFLHDAKKNVFFANEINPLPGTLYHHLWKASGIEFPKLLELLLDFARESHEGRKRVTYTFQSDILRQGGGAKLKGFFP